eukprot:2900631-Karenia_brevis.AAC.1
MCDRSAIIPNITGHGHVWAHGADFWAVFPYTPDFGLEILNFMLLTRWAPGSFPHEVLCGNTYHLG